MKLREVLQELEILDRTADLEQEITGISCDSRTVHNGDLFVAVRGYESDGHRFISNAVANGAACVLCEQEMCIRDSRGTEPRRASGGFYGRVAGSFADCAGKRGDLRFSEPGGDSPRGWHTVSEKWGKV